MAEGWASEGRRQGEEDGWGHARKDNGGEERLRLWLLAIHGNRVRILPGPASSFEFQVSPKDDKSGAGNEKQGA